MDTCNANTPAPLFHFILKPVEDCVLNGDTVKNIWWFYLTDSWYCINCGPVQLFATSKERMKRQHEPPLLDYYYIRWLEDFFDSFPQICQPIPADLYQLIDSEERRTETERKLIDYFEQHEDTDGLVPQAVEDTYLSALQLVHHGLLDTGFLRFRSVCRFCRVEDDLVLHYDFRDRDEDGHPAWSAGVGHYVLPYGEFLAELADMLHRFFHAMDGQIDHAVELARKNPESYCISGNKPATTPDEIRMRLETEQAERRQYFQTILQTPQKHPAYRAICWDTVRQALAQVGLFA